MAIRVGRGRATIVIEGAAAENVERWVREAIGPAMKVLDDEAARAVATAKETWPVRTGKSRDALHSELRVIPGELMVEALVVSTDYARYIVSSKDGTKINAMRPRNPVTRMRQDIFAHRPQMTEALKRAIAEQWQRRVIDG